MSSSKSPIDSYVPEWMKEIHLRLRQFIHDLRVGRLTKYLPHGLYLVFLGVVYIGNRHHIDRTIRHIEKTKLEVESLRADYLQAHAAYMRQLNRKEIVARAKALGLVESSKPPEVIYIDSKKGF